MNADSECLNAPVWSECQKFSCVMQYINLSTPVKFEFEVKRLNVLRFYKYCIYQ